MPARYETPPIPSPEDRLDDDRLVQLSRSLTRLDLTTSLGVLGRSRKERSYALAYLEGLHRLGFYELPGRTKDRDRNQESHQAGIAVEPAHEELSNQETRLPSAPTSVGIAKPF